MLFAVLAISVFTAGDFSPALPPREELTTADAFRFYRWEGQGYQVDMERVCQLFPRYKREDYSSRVEEPFPDPYYEDYRDCLLEECWYDPEQGDVHHWVGSYGERWKTRRAEPVGPWESGVLQEAGIDPAGWTVGDFEDWQGKEPSGRLLSPVDGLVIQEEYLGSYPGREGEFVPIPSGLVTVLSGRSGSPPQRHVYTQVERETIRRWRITKEDFHSLGNRGFSQGDVLALEDAALLELFCGLEDGRGFDGWYDALPPEEQAFVDSLIDREAGEGYLLYSLFPEIEDWRRLPREEIPHILGWENWLSYVKAHGYTEEELEQLLRYQDKPHGDILWDIWSQ